MSSARRRAVRAVLSALAGGGLTAVSLGVALPPASLAAGTSATEGGASTALAGETSGAQTQTGSDTVTTPAAAGTSTTGTPAPEATQQTVTVPVPTPKAPEAPTVVLQRRQKKASQPKGTLAGDTQTTSTAQSKKAKEEKEAASSNVALSPQLVAAQASALASTEASVQALGYYRIPLFLLPVYKAAAVQYGVPWQILAAINEIETDYGSDLSVSSAGAVGWMQFMPATWLQYGVDALNAGYADPYNPVDAIFAAARYLKAAGAATDLKAAILAYNHSGEYVSSVLLRAKLISDYPKAVIATLTGLVDGRLPVTGTEVAWSAASATAGATAVAASAGSSAAATGQKGATQAAGLAAGAAAAAESGLAAAPAPGAVAATARKHPGAPQMVSVTTGADARVVAVQDGRVMKLGRSRKLGRYLVLRDVYGDLFTYADLGRIASTYTLPKAPSAPTRSAVVEVAAGHDPRPTQAASAGSQGPVTLHVKPERPGAASQLLSSGQAILPAGAAEAAPAGMGRVRLFAHPGNPDARAAARADATERKLELRDAQRLPLKPGAVVATGTVLGTVSTSAGSQFGHIRFSIRPAGDAETIAPGPILANWAELQASLHPLGARAEDPLLGATASDVLLLSKAQLQRSVLSDPGISIYACGRQDIASGAIDKRILAVLAFLSRSGLDPTVSGLRCEQAAATSTGAPTPAFLGDSVEISAINGVPLAGHQGAGTITDLTVRTLMTLPAQFVPSSILSLMHYPGFSGTVASSGYWNRIAIRFRPEAAPVAIAPAAAAAAAHSARKGKDAPAPVITTSSLSSEDWSQLVTRIAEIPTPTVRHKPSSSAIPDHKRA
jgi:membrane-bound lytic murein transglycosylase B